MSLPSNPTAHQVHHAWLDILMKVLQIASVAAPVVTAPLSPGLQNNINSGVATAGLVASILTGDKQ